MAARGGTARGHGTVKSEDVTVVPAEEPAEAQPPAGVVLEEPDLAQDLDVEAGAPEVEASAGEMAALLAAVDLEPVADLTEPAPRERWEPFVGAFVRYVAGRHDMDQLGPGHAPADVIVALVIGVVDDDHVDLRLFPRCEGVPYRATVPLILDPGEVTLDHQGRCYRPQF